MWRGRTLGNFKCGRKATTVMTTMVGFTRTHYVCDDGECSSSISNGYPARFRALSK